MIELTDRVHHCHTYCRQCGATANSKDLLLKQSGKHIGVYCRTCRSWLKWLRQRADIAAKSPLPDQHPLPDQQQDPPARKARNS